MKHWNFKSFAAGAVAATLAVGMGVPALASRLEQAELYFDNIKIRLNGEEISTKRADGVNVEPFIIDGTTYLPVRSVAEALDLNVSWDGKTKTVILGNDIEKGQPAVWLQDLTTFDGGAYGWTVEAGEDYDDETTANDGSTYDRGIYGKNGNPTYLLKGQYTRMTGVYYLTKSNRGTESEFSIKILADDEVVYESPVMTHGVEPAPIDIDLTGVYKLEIQGDVRNDFVRLGNAALWNN